METAFKPPERNRKKRMIRNEKIVKYQITKYDT